MLSLDNYFFPSINVQANPHYNPQDKEAGSKSAVDITGAFNVGEDGRSCSAVLDINVRSPDDETQVPYEIDITAVGSFAIPEGMDDKNLVQTAPLFAFSILYTSSREMILTLTGRGPWNRLMLPVHHFHARDLRNEAVEGLPPGKNVSTKSRARQK